MATRITTALPLIPEVIRLAADALAG